MEEDILQGQEPEETTATPTINVGAMKALDAALAKKFGDKYFGPTNGRKVDPVKFISTGCMSIDYVLGGGLPVGRLIEVFGQPSTGKSLLSMQAVKSYQEQGKICAWIDMEACFEPTFAGYCGVDVDKLALLQPDSSEEALEALRDFVKSGVVDLVVLDSVAALSSRTAQEKQVDEATMAVTARYMSKVLPELCPIATKNGCTIIFINQIRSTLKMYGCFHEETPVRFADGSTHFIREVVEKNLEGPILSYNQATKTFEPKKIINWFYNGTLDLDAGQTWLSFTLESQAHPIGGITSFTCTPNHKILVPDGSYIPAEVLQAGDFLVSNYTSYLESNQIYQDILFGSLLGDGQFKTHSQNSSYFSLANSEQPEYLQWKLEKLRYLDFQESGKPSKKTYISRKLSREFSILRASFYKDSKRFIPTGLKLSPLMAAVWYMDDGTFDSKDYHCRGRISVKRWAEAPELQTYIDLLAEFLSISPIQLKTDSRGSIHLKTEDFKSFCERIKAFVPPCMQYKLPEECRGAYEDFESGELTPQDQPHLVKIRKIEVSKRKLRSKHKYDLQVEDNANYLVGGYYGAVVHNSPEDTPGGNAIKFSASIRLKVTRKDILKQGATEIGVVTEVKAQKNKVASPFRAKELSIYFPHFDTTVNRTVAGVDVLGDLVDAAIDCGAVNKGGAWLTGTLAGKDFKVQGKEKLKTELTANPDMIEDLKAKVAELRSAAKAA